MAPDTKAAPDAEVMAFVVAVDDNEIIAAMHAKAKNPSPAVMEYARMLHVDHGKKLDATLKLGMQLGMAPADTMEVDALRQKGAGGLADILPLEGAAFDKAFIDMMVTGHTEALALYDGKLMTMATNDALKAHLATARGHVAHHLEATKALQAR